MVLWILMLFNLYSYWFLAFTISFLFLLELEPINGKIASTFIILNIALRYCLDLFHLSLLFIGVYSRSTLYYSDCLCDYFITFVTYLYVYFYFWCMWKYAEFIINSYFPFVTFWESHKGPKYSFIESNPQKLKQGLRSWRFWAIMAQVYFLKFCFFVIWVQPSS